jgi:hypothetical protein
MVLLLETAGVKTTAELAKRDAATTAAAVLAANKEEDYRKAAHGTAARRLDRPGQEAAPGPEGK